MENNEANSFKVLLVSTNVQASQWFRSIVEVRYPVEFETVLSDRAALNLLEKNARYDLVIHDECSRVLGMSAFIERAISIAPGIAVVALVQKRDGFTSKEAFDVIEVPTLRVDFVRVLSNLKEKQHKGVPEAFDTEYLPSRIEALSAQGTLICDCFIKLSDSKFLKVHKKGDRLETADRQKYQEKGVSTLYISKDDYAFFASEIEKQLSSLPLEAKLTLNRYLQDCAADLYRQLGFTAELEQTVMTNVTSILKAIEGDGPDLSALKEMISTPIDYQNAHGVAVAYVACGLAERLEWQDDQNPLKLTLAALLHDLTLSNPFVAKFQNIDDLKEAAFKDPTFTPRDVKEFETHVDSACTLATRLFPTLHDIEKIIAQHHERPDGSGFPRKLFASQIAPLSALFIVSHEIVKRWIDRPDFEMKNFVNEYALWFNEGAFKKIKSALEWE